MRRLWANGVTSVMDDTSSSIAKRASASSYQRRVVASRRYVLRKRQAHDSAGLQEPNARGGLL